MHEHGYNSKIEMAVDSTSIWEAGIQSEDTLWICFPECKTTGRKVLDFIDVSRLKAIRSEDLNDRLDIAQYDDIDDVDGKKTVATAPLEAAVADPPPKPTLHACLDKFIAREQLDETNTMYCSGCKEHLPPVKKLDLWAVPDVLIVHLKRFRYMQGGANASFVHREKVYQESL
jgi:hypothetical protein